MDTSKLKSNLNINMRLINLDNIGEISRKNIRKFISTIYGFKATTKDLKKIAIDMGLDIGKRKDTQKTRTYKFFGEMYNDDIEKKKNISQQLDKQIKILEKKRGKTYTALDLNKDLLTKRPFKNMFKSSKSKRKPFSVNLISRVVSNVKLSTNFNNYWQFRNWLEYEEKWNGMEMNSGETIIKIGNEEAEVWDLFNMTINFIEGGKTWGENKKTITRNIKFLNYECKVLDPATSHVGDNNCGIRVLSKLLDIKLNPKSIRKEINSPAGTLINTEQLNYIYKKNNGRKNLIIIDENYEGEFNLKDTDYVLYKDNHYTAIIEAKRQNHKETGKKKQKGKLAFDIETRHTEEIIMVGETKSKVLKSTILSMVYKCVRGKKMKKTFTTDNNKNCCVKFLDWLGHEANNGRYYNCVAHNGSRFDFYLLMSYFTEEDLLDSKTQLRGTSIIGLQYKSHTFKDSCCFLTDNLNNLCNGYLITPEEKAFSKLTNIKIGDKTITNHQLCFYKPELNFNEFMELETKEPEFWTEYVKYCEYDCESLFLVWEKFKFQIDTIIGKMGEWLKKSVSLNTCNTIGSLSKKLIDANNGVKSKKQPTKEMQIIRNKYKNGNKWKYGVCKADYNEEVKKLKESGNELYEVGGITGKPNFRKYCEFMSNDEEKYEFIKNFKRGGISHSNQKGYHKEGVCGFDIKSQYPTALMNMKIPVGKSRWVENYEPTAYGFYLINNIKWCSNVKLFKPVANKKDDGILDWATNKFNELYCDSYMIKYLKENCGLVNFNVIKGLVSNEEMISNKLFGTYVDTLYKEKAHQDYLKDSNQEYNKPYREAIKLLMNSLTGKLVEDPSRYFKLEFKSNDEKTQSINNVKINKTDANKGINYWVVAGVMVYSYSKRLLWEYINCLPNKADDVIHIETDGIYFGLPNKDAFIKNLKEKNDPIIRIGRELGNVEQEICTKEESFFIGKKDYMIGEPILNNDKSINYNKSKIRNKGIPKTTINDEGNKIDLLNKQFYIDRYNGKTCYKTFKTIGKALYDTKHHSGITLTGYDMVRKSTPHDFKNFKMYEEKDGKVIIKDWKKYKKIGKNINECL